MKTKQEFMKFFAGSAGNGLLMGDRDVMDPDQMSNILVALFEEPVFRLPDYQFQAGQLAEISAAAIEFGFEGIIPEYMIEKDKVEFDYWKVLFNQNGLAMFIHPNHTWMISVISQTQTAIAGWQSLIDEFKIPEDSRTINNIGVLRVNTNSHSMVPVKYEDLQIQDDTIIKGYPWNREIKDLLKRESGGSFIFHGEPGGGKSSYIRWLAQENPNLDFYLCGMSALLLEGGIRFLGDFITKRYSKRRKNREVKDMVIIIEDAEKIISERSDKGGAPTSELLNLIDGSNPGTSHVKFVFTFNQKVTRTDAAILRPGRLLKIIEFKKLTGEELMRAAEGLGISGLTESEINGGMTVAELVYYGSDTGYKKAKLGFGN